MGCFTLSSGSGAKDRDGLAKDDGLFPAPIRRNLDVRTLFVQLIGEAQFYVGGRSLHLRPGDFALCPYVELQGYAHQGRQRLLVIEWRSGTLSTKELSAGIGPLGLGKQTFERLRKLSDALVEKRLANEQLPAFAATVLGTLRGEGLPFDPWTTSDLHEIAPAQIIRLSAAIDSGINDLSARPGMADLEGSLGWTRQYINRLACQFQKRYWLSSGGKWREEKQAWRLLAGLSMMSRPEARTEVVAQALGYSSPRAFCNAFANAGLPSPGALRDVLRQRGYRVPA